IKKSCHRRQDDTTNPWADSHLSFLYNILPVSLYRVKDFFTVVIVPPERVIVKGYGKYFLCFFQKALTA
ncbi:MAG: hypothetical protein IKV50_07560, partial [Clostridia bacterium]|nr:hypothetical protein [Clostridia bacterium]